jgi:acetyl-CoA C-acetyltransferase
MTPVEAIRRVLAKTGWAMRGCRSVRDQRAFSVQLIAVLRQLGVDPGTVNVNGGAVALGHPIGASGARILTTLLYALAQRQQRRGIAALCLGGGNGVAIANRANVGGLRAGPLDRPGPSQNLREIAS